VGHYSSAPGGDLHQIGDMPQTILVCICGEPKSPNIGGVRGGRTATAEIGSFLESLQKAQEARARVKDDIQTIVESAAATNSADLVLKTEFRDEIAKLREQVETTVVHPLLQLDGQGNTTVVAPAPEKKETAKGKK
jgi:hypothetical protein